MSNSYEIKLDITSSATSKQTFKELQNSFKKSDCSMNELNKTFSEIASHTDDLTEVEKQYNKVIAERLKEKDKEIDKLKAEKISIIANKNLTKEQKEELISLKDEEIKRLETDKKYIKAKEKEAKLLAKINKTFKTNLDENSKAFKVAQGLVKVQEKLNKLLGKESTLRKAITKAGSVAAKGVGMAVGAGAGVVAALGAAAVAGADKTNQKAQAMKSLKTGVGEDVLDELYIKTGADYSTIIAAINRVAPMARSQKEIIKYAKAEIENPGAGLLMSQQTDVEHLDYAGLFDQIRKRTGVQDTSSIIQAALESNAVKRGRISQKDYILAYSKLTQQGLDSENANRVINGVLRSQKAQESFLTAFNRTDLKKFVYDRGAKNQLDKIDWLLSVSDSGVEETKEQKSARETAEQLRKFELEKDKMLSKILPSVLPVLKAVIKLVDDLMPIALKIFGYISQGVGKIVEWVEKKLDAETGIGKAMIEAGEDMIKSAAEMVAEKEKSKQENELGRRASGGLVTAPSLCGEAGPELVLPLNNPSRAQNIINNTQTFNFTTPQTGLSLAQTVSENRFIRRAVGW